MLFTLEEPCLPPLCLRPPRLCGHLSLILKVALISADDNRDDTLLYVDLLEVVDSVVLAPQLVQGGALDDRVHQHEALALHDEGVLQGGVLFLPGSIHNFENGGLVIDGEGRAVTLLDGGIVHVHKVV